ncbi:MAG: DNA polymerase III subunit alpha, partial [Ignavibacteriae bacterium]|nr:DNA polymerase III subunit alpha [Ignavibacteriota bacterium]
MDFVHLHNHTHYSLLDALCTPDELIKAAVEDGQKALALTDHGVMFGCYEFYRKAKAAGIKPIIGFEAYVSNGSRFDKTAGKAKTKKKNYYHLVLLAKNQTGYQNLLKLTSLAHTEGFYYKPRIDKELLEKYNEGIVASSACIAGVISHHLINNDYDKAYEEAKYYKDLYGDDFYIELQSHFLTDDQIVLSEAPKIAKKLGLKTIATNDIHYLKGDHAIAHNILLNIKDVTAATSGQVDIYKLRYRTPEMYFKTKEEMYKLFVDFPDALENTLEVADKCNVNLDSGLHMPEFPLPKEKQHLSNSDYLEELTFEGLKKKYKIITDEIADRAKFELNVINKMNFPSYFLIVSDFISAAKGLGVTVGPGRGSAAGSIVAYALGITNIDPLPYDLLFERFLNPDRISMPDIDIDFNDETRERVIEYVRQKYGEECVAQIITFGKLSSRAVLTDVGRVLGVELQKIKEITSKIPVVQGKVADLKDALELSELKWVKNSDDPKIKELINYSLLLENKFRNSGIHAAGVVIAPKDIREFVPVFHASKSKGGAAEIATQYSMNELESAGLLKMDFLGLRTLSIIDRTLKMIRINHGIEVNIDEIDFKNEKTYELISNGDTLAVFQFESQGMQDYLRQLKPKDLEELTAMNALYRPGPMANIPDFIDRKHGRKPIQYLHPLMEKSLKNTYGIIVYQEQ